MRFKLARILFLISIWIALLLLPAGAVQASPADSPYAFIFLIDGIPSPLFQQMLADGKLPNFKDHIYERGVYSQHHVTVFPPVTFPAIASIFSGRYPSGHHIPNFFWVGRNEAMYKNYIGIGFPEYQRDAAQNVYFLFEYFPDERTLSFGLPLDIGGDHTRGLIGSYVDIFREPRDRDYIEKAVQRKHTVGIDMFVRPLNLLSLLNPANESNIISLINPFSPSGILRYSLGSLSERERSRRRQIPTAVLYYEWAINHYAYEDGPWSKRVRDALVEVGPLDESYFFYLEEVDWFRRAARAGWGWGLAPEARVVHQIGRAHV